LLYFSGFETECSLIHSEIYMAPFRFVSCTAKPIVQEQYIKRGKRCSFLITSWLFQESSRNMKWVTYWKSLEIILEVFINPRWHPKWLSFSRNLSC